MPSRNIKNQLLPDEVEDPSKQFDLQDAQGQEIGSKTPAPTNLSPVQIQVDESIQEMLVNVILEDFDSAKEYRDEIDYGKSDKGETFTFDGWMKELSDLYSGNREAKDKPWKFCSNRSLRVAASILEMMHARLLGAVWNEDLIRYKPGEITDTPKVERITKFMNWWVRVWDPKRNFFDDWVKYTGGYGDSLTEGSWKIEEHETNDMVDEPIMDEMGQPLVNPDGTPATQQVPQFNRKETVNLKLITKEMFYLMKGAESIQEDPVIIEEEILFKNLQSMEKNGQAINVADKLLPLIDYEKPQGNISPEKEESIRQIKLRNKPVRVLRWYGHYDISGSGFEESVRICIAPDQRIYLGGIRVRDITKSGRRPIEYAVYSKYVNRINEMFGKGILDEVRELSKEIDAIFNQLVDSNTISIMKPGFYDPSGDLDAPALTLSPNKLIPVTDPQRNVFFPDYTIDTNRLVAAIGLVSDFIERLTAASNFVMGQEGKYAGGSGTATRTAAIVQSAELRFTAPAERLRYHASRILDVILDLVQLNIPPGMENRVLGEKNEPLFGENELTQQGISGKYDAYIVSDPSMGSKQTEREMASMLYSLLLQNILVGSDPIKIYRVTADLLKSYDKDPVEYLGPAPSMDDIDEPEDENTLIIQGDWTRVKANLTENHLLHIKKHQDLMTSPSLQQLSMQTPVLAQGIMQFLNQHIMEHQGMMQAMVSLMKQFTGGGETGAGDSGNTGDITGQGATGGQIDAKRGVENTQGPAAQALSQTQQGTIQPASQRSA